MPSRPAPADFTAEIYTPELPHHHHHHHRVLVSVLAGTLAFTAIAVVLSAAFFIYRKLSYNRTAPFEQSQGRGGGGDAVPCQNHRRFSYALLRRATASFSAANLLGHGGFGSVYKATLPSGESVAVKVMDSEGSAQGEREFENELSLALNLSSPHVLSLLGFSNDGRRRKLLLVYELMPNRSLQEALFDGNSPEIMDWKRRFRIALDIALGLEYLHHGCDPPVIHGDVKPSNILLDSDFAAKIGDFGLARLKTEDHSVVVEEDGEYEETTETKDKDGDLDNGSIVEEGTDTASVLTGGFDRSPRASEASPSEDLSGTGRRRFGGGGGASREWWWKQDSCGGSESGRVKDYVMEWIGSEISKERPKPLGTELESGTDLDSPPKKKRRRRLEWWSSMEDESNNNNKNKKKKKKKPREWWKEEFCDELTRKHQHKQKKKNKSTSAGVGSALVSGEDRSRKKSRGKSMDWSSTPSMRGTVCYVAPEYGGGVAGAPPSEKCDVYSYGVLVLVLVSGRRPLQVTASPMSEFERANLTSWARQLARNGRLLDLVDPALHSVDREEASLCLTIALLCLQRTPAKRPSMKDIVGMLSGESEPPHLPFEFSPSPPSNLPFKSRKKAR